MSTFYTHKDKKSGDGLAITDWNELSNAVAGNQGLHLALDPTDKVGIGINDPKSKLDVEGGVAIGAAYSGTNAAPANGLLVEGNVGIGTTSVSSGVKLEVNGTIKVPYKESVANASISIGDDTFHDGNIYALRFGESETNQLGMGTYTSTRRVFSDSSNGLGIHVHSDAEFSVKSSSWTNLFGIRGGTGNAYFKGNVGIGTRDPEYKLDFGDKSASTIRLVSGNNGTAIRIGADPGSNVTLLRVDGINNGKSDSANLGFSLKYMGSKMGNANSLSVFSDNQRGTQVEALTILQDGNVGIGTMPSAGVKLEVSGDVKVRGKLYLYDTSGGNGGSDNWLWLQNNQVQTREATSDKRLKKNIDVISGALRKITSLRGVSYKWNEHGLQQKTKDIKEQFISKENTPEANEKLWSEQIQRIKEENSGTYKGFIAQELETVFPEWVQEGEDGFKTIDTSELTAVLVEAIKELNDKFESALEKLTKKVATLAKKVK